MDTEEPVPAYRLTDLALASNALGFDLLAKLRQAPGNLALSPVGISTALTVAWAGARGDTADQMRRVLHAEEPASEATRVAGALRARLGEANEGALSITTALFADSSVPLESSYVETIRAAFGHAPEAADFRRAPEPSRERINAWVLGATEGRVRNLLERGSVNGDTRLVLANAVHFLADWLFPFKHRDTRPLLFHPVGEAPVHVPAMNDTRTVSYAALDDLKIIDLPYKGGAAAMTFILPDRLRGLDEVEARLDGETVGRWIGAMRPLAVRIAIPKLEIGPTSFALSDVLAALGMSSAFRRDADFTGISNPARLEDRLFISTAIHNAFVKVDEKGTEAAAATVVLMNTLGAVRRPEGRREFIADHPFLFLLRDLGSRAILFLGRVANPATLA